MILANDSAHPGSYPAVPAELRDEPVRTHNSWGDGLNVHILQTSTPQASVPISLGSSAAFGGRNWVRSQHLVISSAVHIPTILQKRNWLVLRSKHKQCVIQATILQAPTMSLPIFEWLTHSVCIAGITAARLGYYYLKLPGIGFGLEQLPGTSVSNFIFLVFISKKVDLFDCSLWPTFFSNFYTCNGFSGSLYFISTILLSYFTSWFRFHRLLFVKFPGSGCVFRLVASRSSVAATISNQTLLLFLFIFHFNWMIPSADFQVSVSLIIISIALTASYTTVNRFLAFANFTFILCHKQWKVEKFMTSDGDHPLERYIAIS